MAFVTELVGVEKRRIEHIAVVDQKHIQVAIAVVVEKAGLGRERTRRVEAVLGGAFGKRGYVARLTLVVDKQLVSPRRRVVQGRVAHVNIEPAIGIDVGHGHAGFPVARPSGYARCFGHVLELQWRFGRVSVDVQFVG